MYLCIMSCMKKFGDIHKYIWLECGIWFLILCVCIAGIRFHFYKKQKELVTYQLFMPDVDGLIVGSPVKFMGVDVGYVDRVKIVSNDVYVKIVITDKDITLPKGSIATVEFSGMGGSKSLEIYPPTNDSLATNKLIDVESPKRLYDSLGLLNQMFDKIDSITNRLSVFAKETNGSDMSDGVNIDEIQGNMDLFDKWLKRFSEIRKDAKEEVNNEQEQSPDNQ